MPRFLIDHLKGCTPLNPCLSCETATWLRTKLKPADLAELLRRIHKFDAAPEIIRQPLDKELKQLDLPLRAWNSLLNDNIVTIADVLKKREAELLRIPNFGRRSLNDLKRVLRNAGHELGEPVPEQ